MQPNQPLPQQVVISQPGQVGYVMHQGTPVGSTVVMGGFPATSAQLALILSIVSIFIGSICLAIPSLIISQNALNITNMYPGHPDAGTAKAARIISWVVIALFIAIIILYAFLIIWASSLA
tara:strand:+ start:1628 stop:1990 length:363 start_codon:yes stop_codon:yes gene_type:complete